MKINLGFLAIEFYSQLSFFDLLRALTARYDEKIMNALLDDRRYVSYVEVQKVKSKNLLSQKIFKGRLVVRGAYDLYKNFLKDKK